MLRAQLTLALLAFCSLFSKAQNAIEDYDSLSRLSSATLMESGRKLFEQRVASKALACFMIVGERFKANGNEADMELSIKALNNCGCVYKFLYFDYVQAYDYFIRAYDLCEAHHFDRFSPVVLVNLADLLNDYGLNYGSESMRQHATKLFELCMEKAYEQKNWELMTTAFFNLSSHDYDLDLSKFQLIFSDEIPPSTPDLSYVRLQYKGIESIQHKRYAEARGFFLQQLPLVSARWEPVRDTLSTYIAVAHTYVLEGLYPLALGYLERGLQLSERNKLGDRVADVCLQISDCHRLMGDTVLQQYYYTLYLEKMDMVHRSRLSSVAELNYIHELKKQEAKATELSLRQKLQQYVILAIFIVLLVVIGSAFLLWRQNRRLHAANRVLFESYQRMMRAEAEEQKLRKSIAYSHSSLNEEQKEMLIFRIQEVMSDAKAICQQDFTLAGLAKLVDSNTTYVSQVINEKYGMTFSILLGNHRVKEACRRISEEGERYTTLTIEAIASGVGFKSRTAFINAFKREVGLTPSEYMRMANSEK